LTNVRSEPSVRLASLPFADPHRCRRGLPAAPALSTCIATWAVTCICAVVLASVADGAELTANPEENHAAVMKLAAEIAGQGGGDPAAHKSELVTDYENVYGSTSLVPNHWPALVRRALVCREIGDRVCAQSSIVAIDGMGGVDSLPLNHLLEVSRFKMPVESIRTALQAVQQAGADAVVARASAAGHDRAPAPTGAAAAGASIGAGAPAVHAAERATAKAGASAKASAVKPAAPRSLVQRATARLKRLGGDDQSAFFLDALFVSVAISPAPAYFLFAATRTRKNVLTDATAAQKIMQLENLLAEEKLRTEQAIELEKTNSEMVMDAQKAHAEHLLKEAQLAMAEAVGAEKARADELLRNERLRVTEVIEAANQRAEQAIDEGVQRAVTELEKSLRQIEILRQALQVEKEQRAVLDARTGDAARAVEALRATEARLRAEAEARANQAAQAPEVRGLTEKLHAAQRAAISLHGLLIAARARNAELESKAAEAMQAAEIKGAEVHNLHPTRQESERAQAGNVPGAVAR
jgi:hypothetical protein